MGKHSKPNTVVKPKAPCHISWCSNEASWITPERVLFCHVHINNNDDAFTFYEVLHAAQIVLKYRDLT